MFLRQRLDARQVDLGTAGDGACRKHAQAPVLHETIQPDADRSQIADHLAAIRIKTDEQGVLAALAGRLGEGTTQGRLGGAREAGDQHAGAAVVATAQHGVQPLDAAGNTFVGHLSIHPANGAGDDDLETVPADEEGRLILIEAGAAILLYAQAALRDAQHHAVLEHHGAVDHELHEAEWLSAERTVFVAAGLQGNDGRHFARQ